jgi:16S rRNA (cytosine967-C5)-methyltransferase
MVSPADKVLVDAPCSGLGVLAKRPDARWRKQPDQIEELVILQRKLLDSAAGFVKTGGALIYSTCTISKDENQDVVEGFLAKHPEFEIEDVSVYLSGRLKPKEHWVQFYPHHNGLDGIFVARMIRL